MRESGAIKSSVTRLPNPRPRFPPSISPLSKHPPLSSSLFPFSMMIFVRVQATALQQLCALLQQTYVARFRPY